MLRKDTRSSGVLAEQARPQGTCTAQLELSGEPSLTFTRLPCCQTRNSITRACLLTLAPHLHHPGYPEHVQTAGETCGLETN